MDSIGKFFHSIGQQFSGAVDTIKALLSGETQALQKTAFIEKKQGTLGEPGFGQKLLAYLSGSSHNTSAAAKPLATGLSSFGGAAGQSMKHTNALGNRKEEALRLVLGSPQESDNLEEIEQIMSSTSGLLEDRIEMREESKQQLQVATSELQTMQDKLLEINDLISKETNDETKSELTKEANTLGKFISIKGYEVEKISLEYKKCCANVKQNMAANLRNEEKDPSIERQLYNKRMEHCDEFRDLRSQIEEIESKAMDHASSLVGTYSTETETTMRTQSESFDMQVTRRDEAKQKLDDSKTELASMKAKARTNPSETNPLHIFISVKEKEVEKLELKHRKESINTEQHKLEHLANSEPDNEKKSTLNYKRDELIHQSKALNYELPRMDSQKVPHALLLIGTYFPGQSASAIDRAMGSRSTDLKEKIDNRDDLKKKLEEAENEYKKAADKFHAIPESLTEEREKASQDFRKKYNTTKDLQGQYEQAVSDVEKMKLSHLIASGIETDLEKKKLLTSTMNELGS